MAGEGSTYHSVTLPGTQRREITQGDIVKIKGSRKEYVFLYTVPGSGVVTLYGPRGSAQAQCLSAPLDDITIPRKVKSRG